MTARGPTEPVAAFLRRIRQAAGLTQDEAALRVGVSRGEWNKFENGKRGIGEVNAERIARAFGVAATDLLSRPRQQPSGEALVERLEDLIDRGEQLADRLEGLLGETSAHRDAR